MEVTVTPTKVYLGPVGSQFIPRPLPGPTTLIVPFGTVYEVGPHEVWTDIEVTGTLRFSRARATTLEYVTLLILPAGTMDVGTEANPNLESVTFIGRNVPIDFTKDPYQWGNGIFNAGTQFRVGRAKDHCIELSTPALAGDTTITLEAVPMGWEVGDALSIPDTDLRLEPRVEADLFIDGISGTTITLSKSLDFDHLPFIDPRDGIVGYACACNLTRNIVVKSEDPTGTPTHNVDTGMATVSDIRYNAFIGCGRTTTAVLNNTTQSGGTITHVGTNQVAKYADHFHHAHGHDCTREGNVYIGLRDRGCKWGLVVHGTHDTHVSQNVAIHFPGACFITEDGPETRNTFHHNVAMYSLGGPGNGEADRRIIDGQPGSEGTGFWMHGVRNYYDGNEAWNCRTGFNPMNQQQQFYDYPSVPGGPHDTLFNQQASDVAVPLEFTDQGLFANGLGLDFWATMPFDVAETRAYYNAVAQVGSHTSNHVHMRLIGGRLLGRNGASQGLVANEGYLSSLYAKDLRIAGCDKGITGGGGIESTHLIGLSMQSMEDYDFTFYGDSVRIEDSENSPMPGQPQNYLRVGNGEVWNGALPFPPSPDRNWARVPTVRVTNWNGNGQDTWIVQPQQISDTIAVYSSQVPAEERLYTCPEVGMTAGACFSTYGVAYGGIAVDRAALVPMDGLINCFATPAPLHFGPPRCAMTSPTMREPAIVFDNSGVPRTLLRMVITGEMQDADEVLAIQMDAEPVRLLERRDNDPAHVRVTDGPAGSGTHTGIMWRRNRVTGVELPGSRRIANWFAGVTPLPAPPPPILTGPLVAGMTTVSGTGTAGATVTVIIGGIDAGTDLVNGLGEFVVTVPALVAGQVVTATQTLNGLISPVSNILTVQGQPVPVWHDEPTKIQRLGQTTQGQIVSLVDGTILDV